jgi:hypothetical protein
MPANIVDNKYLQSFNGRRWWCETELSSTYDDFSDPSLPSSIHSHWQSQSQLLTSSFYRVCCTR